MLFMAVSRHWINSAAMLMAISPGWLVPSGRPIGQRKLSASSAGMPASWQFADQHLAFGLAADDAQVGRDRRPCEDCLENRPIGFVAHRHADHEIVAAQLIDELRACHRNCTVCSLAACGSLASHSAR